MSPNPHLKVLEPVRGNFEPNSDLSQICIIHSRHSDKHLDKIWNFFTVCEKSENCCSNKSVYYWFTKFGIFLPFVKKVRIVAVIKVFTIGFNGKNGFFSHCKKFNIKICVKLGKILMSTTMKILKLKRIIFTV